jgi:hypothetical protein
MINQRLPQSKKDEKWYQENVDSLDKRSFSSYVGSYTSQWYKNKINYDLYNNIIHVEDFEYVCRPWGDAVGELPAQMTNRDISSGKINAILGIEARRPFPYRLTAVNSEATTRREQAEFGMLKDYVIQKIMAPIQQQAMQEAQQAMMQAQQTGQQPQIEPPKTPQEVKRYMAREYQDPAEVLGNQILNYLNKEENIEAKFLKGAKHAAISGIEVYYIGEISGKPTIRPINPLYFDYDKSPDEDYIEDGQWAVAEYRMTPADIVAQFSHELTDEEIDTIYERWNDMANLHFEAISFGQTDSTDTAFSNGEVRVIHAVWKSLRKIGILKTQGPQGIIEEVVSEDYKKGPNDIEVNWYWVPEVHQCWRIGKDIYKGYGPLPNQHKDIDKLYECKLPYVGAAYDNTNSAITSLMDRIRPFQYLYNIFFYRMELLAAQDKGKKFATNMNAIPVDSGMDLAKWQYHADADSVIYLDPSQEGNKHASQNIGEYIKEVDMSLTSDLAKYQQILAYIEQMAGEAVGVPKQLEGMIQEREAVQNVDKVLTLTSNKLEPFFKMHDIVKRNALQALVESAKVIYSQERPAKLDYILDDLSREYFEIDPMLLSNSTYGIYIADASTAAEARQTVQEMARFGLQNQLVSMSTVIKALNTDTAAEAEELLKAAEEEMREKQQEMQKAQQQHEQQMSQMEFQNEMQKLAYERETKLLLEQEERKTRIMQQAVFSSGFAEDKDMNDNNQLDSLDIAEHFLEKEKVELEKEKQIVESS